MKLNRFNAKQPATSRHKTWLAKSCLATMTLRIILALVLCSAVQIASAETRTGSTVFAENCASCHDSVGQHAPSSTALKQLPVGNIVRSLETGVMRIIGTFQLNGPERVAVAEFLTGETYDPNWKGPSTRACNEQQWPAENLFAAPHWNGWGNGSNNLRFQDATAAKLDKKETAGLKLQWAFAFPGETIAEAQPTIVDGRLFVGSRSGRVYALDAKSACEHWHFDADSPVKNSVLIHQLNVDGAAQTIAYFGDLTGTAYAVDANTGTLLWRRKVDPFPSSRLMGSFMIAGNELFVPLTAMESTEAASTEAVCCVFRGSVAALDLASGEEKWRQYTIEEEPKETGTNAVGNPSFGPAGATVWSTPTYDKTLGRLYVGTGENSAHPATNTSDAILAIDVKSKSIAWSYQGHAADAWNMSCGTADKTNCPTDAGPDYDFGSSPILATLNNGKRMILAGQKSGVMHALDPDNNGKLLWQRKVAQGGVLGGIEWGSAVDDQHVYVALADIRWATDDLLAVDVGINAKAGGGLVALKLANGEVAWEAPPIDCGDRPQCSPAQTAGVTAIPGVVFSGSVSGHMRAFSATTGEVLWQFDTVKDYKTINGAKGRGGAIDGAGPVVVDGWVYVMSGYSKWGGLAGNVLLAFATGEQ